MSATYEPQCMPSTVDLGDDNLSTGCVRGSRRGHHAKLLTLLPLRVSDLRSAAPGEEVSRSSPNEWNHPAVATGLQLLAVSRGVPHGGRVGV